MKKDKIIVMIVVMFVLVFTICAVLKIYFPRVYINSQKSDETKVEVGSEKYLSRILESIYFDKRFPVEHDDIINTYVNSAIDGNTYWYYAFSNDDIIRIGEDYSFVYYSKCNYWNLSTDLPTIVGYESAYKYQITPYSLWYFIWYDITSGVEYNNNEIIDDSIFTTYKINWLGKGDKTIDFVKTRIFMYHYLRYIDEDLNSNGFSKLGSYNYIKQLRMEDIEQEYVQDMKLSLNSMLYYAYFDEGKMFEEWIKVVLPEYKDIITQIETVEDYQTKINEYMSKISVVNDVPKINTDNPSTLSTEFDEILGIPSKTYCLDNNIFSIYNNYNSNNNIVTNSEYEESDNDLPEDNSQNIQQNGVTEQDSENENKGLTVRWDSLSSIGEFIGNREPEEKTEAKYGCKQIVYTDTSGEIITMSPYVQGSIQIKEDSKISIQMYSSSSINNESVLTVDGRVDKKYTGKLISIEMRPKENIKLSMVEDSYNTELDMYTWSLAIETEGE